MPDSLQRWMKEVSRLTQSGRFAKAAQFIQQSMAGTPAEPAPTNPETVIELPMSDAASATSTPPVDSAVTPEQAGHQGVSLAGQHTEAGLTRAYILYLPPQAALQDASAPRARAPPWDADEVEGAAVRARATLRGPRPQGFGALDP